MSESTENLNEAAKAPLRSRVLVSQAWDEKKYEYDDSFRPYDPSRPETAHTTAELVHALESNPKIEVDATLLGVGTDGQVGKIRISESKTFTSSYLKGPDETLLKKFRERLREDAFASPNSPPGVGTDFTPLLGGAYYKNLYYYSDYIRMHSEAFYAYNHDPIAKATVQITRDFVIGTGYEVQCDQNDETGKRAMAAWKAFDEANNLQEQMDQCTTELSIYGEVMFWELPDQQTKLVYRLPANDPAPRGVIPRVRLMDPSMFVEIVTYPEDITRKLFYVILVPTQYQIYGGLASASGPGGPEGTGTSVSPAPPQPTLKFLYQQVPASQILHYKINAVSNEKRGRSDLYPILGYLKRLRDSVDYSIIALQKVAAWAMDTSIQGSQADVDAYVANQAAMGTIAPAGSEFVHTKAIERKYNGNSNAGGHTSDAFEWTLSMCAAGVQIPISYYGMHLSGSSTRANAIIGTEPVAKKMEKRRETIKRILKDLWTLCQKRAGNPFVECEVIFPEIITQDRSQKMKDLSLAQEMKWISPKRAASMSAKELQISDYDYDKEMNEIKEQAPQVPMPLLDPGDEKVPGENDEVGPHNSLTGTDRREIKKNDSSL